MELTRFAAAAPIEKLLLFAALPESTPAAADAALDPITVVATIVIRLSQLRIALLFMMSSKPED
jgi:hypothetical protein